MCFFETPPVFHCFFANVNACSPLASIIRVFGHVGRDLPETHTQPAMYCALCSTTVEGSEKSGACAPRTKKPVWDSGLFAHALFLPKTRKLWGFLAVCKTVQQKTQVFYILVFAKCKWAYSYFFLFSSDGWDLIVKCDHGFWVYLFVVVF